MGEYVTIQTSLVFLLFVVLVYCESHDLYSLLDVCAIAFHDLIYMISCMIELLQRTAQLIELLFVFLVAALVTSTASAVAVDLVLFVVLLVVLLFAVRILWAGCRRWIVLGLLVSCNEVSFFCRNGRIVGFLLVFAHEFEFGHIETLEFATILLCLLFSSLVLLSPLPRGLRHAAPFL